MYAYLSVVFFLALSLKFPVHCESTGNDGPLIITHLNQTYAELQQLARINYSAFGNNAGYSGYFQVNATSETNLFFWFITSECNPEHDPVILCVQGGPGISSLFWLFFENGPFSLDEKGNFNQSKHRWSKTNSILYIDIPAEVGFSTTKRKTVQSLAEVTEDLMEALKQFFQLFSDFRGNPFYIVGEGYGGKFAPALGSKIHDYNQEIGDGEKINLKGVAVGNGFTDPKYQTGYGEFLYTLGYINEDTMVKIEDLEKEKAKYIDNSQWDHASNIYNEIFQIFYEQARINMFIILKSFPEYLILEYQLDKYLNQEEVQKALHVGSNQFQTYYSMKLSDDARPASPMIEKLLNETYSVLLYHGQFDARTPYVTVSNYVKEMNFPGASKFENATKNIWMANSFVVGYIKKVGHLIDVLIRDAGRNAAMDLRKYVYVLIDKFTHQNVI